MLVTDFELSDGFDVKRRIVPTISHLDTFSWIPLEVTNFPEPHG